MSILDNAKTVADLVKKYNDMELYQKILDLRDEILTLKEENLKLREKITQLEAEAETQQNVIYEAPFYWIRQDDKRDGPFCQKCYDSTGKLIRLQPGADDYWNCYVCHGGFR